MRRNDLLREGVVDHHSINTLRNTGNIHCVAFCAVAIILPCKSYSTIDLQTRENCWRSIAGSKSLHVHGFLTIPKLYYPGTLISHGYGYPCKF